MVKPSPRLAKVRAVFPSSSRDESRRIGEILRKETVGGILLVSLAAIALLWANSPWAESYFALRDFEIGYEPWHLRLSLGAWAADGLLAIFFFLVGLELKREFVAGDLRRFSTAVVPIVAAVGGVIVPAVIYLAVVAGSPEAAHGWAIPTATDIAFAVAVLAIIGSHLPSALRIFLLTLAVVDDLIAIGIIALFYTETIEVLPLVLALVVIAVYGVIAQRYRDFFHLRPTAAWLILLPIGLVAWALVHASGVHATIAGVLLGFTIPVLHKKADRGPDSGPGLAEVFEHRFRPLSAGFAVPVFAFFSAGVAIGGGEGFVSAFTDPVVVGIVVALVVGKPLGITAATWIITRIRRINLDPSLRWMDIVGVGLLAGIGFTVSLLVAELSFAAGSEHHDHAKVAILTASVVAALAASVLLGIRNRRYRRLDAADAES
ncbi:Na+/H+ antiporter NhaA [Microbacterium sp. KKR3/1]|uniref:Na(+)/H(+) antiporter NhaA n=1 Tax=Microbacterium aurugineum TaxID=2851642 RepID=A0ABY4J1X4_9MICO|nr:MULTISPECIES: Na+/H+ antiporter NhaA [Microbacterium]MCE0508702.1 Na+/H+ antiporter NhaA [Microbacterium sp. KKR3/1]QEA28720.1 Na+/H+ antiporter NhaA [Microbacterium sp. CBA3102]TCJ28263.1 Na+/H+ antiporter NhaA [Microbacterium sp. PI-1]UPL18535.1 Na+/H+ antiporter NhaA [Microbacterium aurugineum]